MFERWLNWTMGSNPLPYPSLVRLGKGISRGTKIEMGSTDGSNPFPSLSWSCYEGGCDVKKERGSIEFTPLSIHGSVGKRARMRKIGDRSMDQTHSLLRGPEATTLSVHGLAVSQ